MNGSYLLVRANSRPSAVGPKSANRQVSNVMGLASLVKLISISRKLHNLASGARASISLPMNSVPAPPVAAGDENRHLFCQAIEIPLQDLIQAAVKAGWDEPEVLTAIIEVADKLMLAHGSNAELDALLKARKRKLE